MSLLLGLAGLSTAYMLVHSGRHGPPASTLETAGPSSPAAKPATDEPSAVATAEPHPVQLLNPSTISPSAAASNEEGSAVATVAPPPIRMPNPPAPAYVTRELTGPATSVASSYATLRQALLRTIR